jgi:hypothetical protein
MEKLVKETRALAIVSLAFSFVLAGFLLYAFSLILWLLSSQNDVEIKMSEVGRYMHNHK